jgi:TPP-dependent pyruvate/acetoin dehydrogenase alpha subunit
MGDAVTISNDLKIKLYKQILFVRRTEEILADEYRKGSMRTPTHFGIGQEGCAVGVCEALNSDDVVFTHHRSHTHYLAKGGSLLGLIAELLGREAGCSKGRGGSVHLIDRQVGFLGSSPILGHSTALATGSALAFSMDQKTSVAVSFFGEGACDEGAVWESFNYAAIKKLPVLFVCENNLYATESPLSVRNPEGNDFCEKAKAFGIHAERHDGNDIMAVYQATQNALHICRSGRGPVFLELMTYRWREHVGPLWDHEVNRVYRSKEELEAWMDLCPVKRMGQELISKGLVKKSDLDDWLLEADLLVNKTMETAFLSPWPKVETLFDNVY